MIRTTSDPTNDFYYELNTWGDHYWFLVMDMDCAQTQEGWFEFNTIYSIGGEEGEEPITQEECSGEVGGSAPFSSINHIARLECLTSSQCEFIMGLLLDVATSMSSRTVLENVKLITCLRFLTRNDTTGQFLIRFISWTLH